MKILQFFVDEFPLVFLWWTRQAPHRPMCRSTCVKAALQTPSMRATAKVTFSAPNSFISLIRVRKLRPEIVERRNHSRWPRFRSARRTFAPSNKRPVISPPNHDTHTDTHRVEKGVAILLSAHTHRAPPRARTFSSAATSSGPQPNCQFQHRNCRVTGTARCECSFLSLLELLRKIELKLKFYKKKNL